MPSINDTLFASASPRLLAPLLPALLLAAPARAQEPPRRGQVQVSPEVRQKSQVCSDGKGHYIVVTPDEPEAGRYTTLYYGDGKRFFEVPGYAGLTRTLFRDPRFFNSRVSPPDRSWGRREVDRRLLSGVALEEGKCSLWCGERDKAFALLEPAKAQTLLKGAVFLPTPRQFQPHALSRDDEGTYYYVDRGYFADTSKNFRLFIGKKGALKPQAITDVISDSGGDVITTKAGTLSIGRGTVQWKSGGKATPLIPLPLADDTDEGPRNLMLVYGELGVYRGERLGTPCDDL